MHQRRGRTDDDAGANGDGDERVQLLRGRPANGSEVISTLAKRAWSSPRVKTGVGLWIVGLAFMTLMPALVVITPEMRSTYESIAVLTTEEIFTYDDALADLAAAEDVLYSSQVWFWRWRPEHKVIVDQNQAIVSAKQEIVAGLTAQRVARQNKANAYVGLWSEYGMSEMKAKFWSSFESGKVFAQRQSFWQMFHLMLTSREEYFLSIFVKWVGLALINFTLGLIGALFYYTYALFGMLFSYESLSLGGVTFFILSFLGGASIVATYLIGLYGITAGGFYVAGRVLVRGAALQYEREERQRRLLRERGQM
ncbi:uncharacterized protein LOC110856469 [Folsomia candida]|uniref:Uncharacterized protein n=1 Tax=Folsomia candida TaxID=158441 RepID=A0A226DM47_FOLCA|nr:uncharacterized protein LOC110856469 [Folsomia candida]XP_035713043.1 uncharacterized protein LOC110856469 [Folsomia candida]XP_035713044.1 uncharacterized protein LOC110856469 [Folsomia candida]OXA45934.1 hypothetical protein Fcan01_19086 [Folsomia candida]